MVLPFIFIRGGRLIATKVREAHLKALGTGSPLRVIDEDGKPGRKQFYFIEADDEHQVWLCWKSGFPIPRKHRIQVLTTPRVEEAKEEQARAHIIVKTPDGDLTLEAPKDKELFELWTRKLTELVEDQAALQAGARAHEDAAAKADGSAASSEDKAALQAGARARGKPEAGNAAAKVEGAAAEAAEKRDAGGAAAKTEAAGAEGAETSAVVA